MKKILLLFFMLFTLGVKGQNDSTTFSAASWNTKSVSAGIDHKWVHFSSGELFASSQFISVIEIKPGSDARIEIFASPVLKETSLMASESGAIAAINGSFFKFNYTHNTEDYNSVDYIRKENRQLAPNTVTGNKRAMHQLGAIAIFNGELYILKADELKEWEKYIQAQEVITTGPILRVAGRDLKLDKSSFYTARHPRSAVGKKADGTILLLTADGRNAQAAGVSLTELQQIMKWLGADYAINLDGGGSTTMYVAGGSDNGVVNHPSDNKLFDNMGQRKVANAILVHKTR